MLALALAAATASVAAIMVQLAGAKGQGQLEQVLRVCLTAATISLSWLFVHLVFAIHYAHVFYTAEAREGGSQQGGLDFPDDDTPDYWDFMYYSFVIGTACATADINLTSKKMRRLTTLHCIVAFFFNTTILALTVNIGAGFF